MQDYSHKKQTLLTVKSPWSHTVHILKKTSSLFDSLTDTSSRPEVFCKKGVLRNFAKFTGKYLCQRLFFNKVAGLRRNYQEHLFSQNTSGGCFCTETSPFLFAKITFFFWQSFFLFCFDWLSWIQFDFFCLGLVFVSFGFLL